MSILNNPYRHGVDNLLLSDDIPWPSVDAQTPLNLLDRCPSHSQTPLIADKTLAEYAAVKALYIKDESQRMGLGSFKALGAAYVIAHQASELAMNRFRVASKAVISSSCASMHPLH